MYAHTHLFAHGLNSRKHLLDQPDCLKYQTELCIVLCAEHNILSRRADLDRHERIRPFEFQPLTNKQLNQKTWQKIRAVNVDKLVRVVANVLTVFLLSSCSSSVIDCNTCSCKICFKSQEITIELGRWQSRQCFRPKKAVICLLLYPQVGENDARPLMDFYGEQVRHFHQRLCTEHKQGFRVEFAITHLVIFSVTC